MSIDLLQRLRATDPAYRIGNGGNRGLLEAWRASGVRFVASSPQMEDQYWRAVSELFSCIKPMGGQNAILQEGGIYLGCWLESTGTINAELLSRFLPDVSAATFAAFADHQDEEGLFPYKLTADGPAFNQIQIVTPLARSVWNHYRLNGDKAFLKKMYSAMARYDDWLAKYRNTRGTGAVEAFCTYDTGHDLSARFWHVPDTPHQNNPKKYRDDNPVLPFVAPDLTANAACQRSYLARIVEELGENGNIWQQKADDSIDALFAHCYDEEDEFFYDLDANGNLVRVQSDVLLRVLACEIGDEDFFATALENYLLNTAKFFAKYPFTSLALDDPRFDPAFDYNSWCGPTNFLSIIRSPHAFEHHHHYAELTWVIHPILSALFKMERFAQTLHPFTGRAGFTEAYSPTILCLLDFVERLCGILPRPEGTLWFTGLVPYQIEHRDADHKTAYSRNVDGHVFELVNSAERSIAYCDGQQIFSFPKGIRVITDRAGTLREIIGMSVPKIEGAIETGAGTYPFEASANQRLEFRNGEFRSVHEAGLVHPTY